MSFPNHVLNNAFSLPAHADISAAVSLLCFDLILDSAQLLYIKKNSAVMKEQAAVTRVVAFAVTEYCPLCALYTLTRVDMRPAREFISPGL